MTWSACCRSLTRRLPWRKWPPAGTTRLAFLQVRHQLVVHRAFRGSGNDGNPSSISAMGPCFIAGRDRTRRAVADFLELERALAADRRAHAAAPNSALRASLHASAASSMAGLHSAGCARPGRRYRPARGTASGSDSSQLALDLRQQHGKKQCQRHHLAPGRTSWSNGNLLVGLRVDDAIGLARHGATHHVGDAERMGALHCARREWRPAYRPSRRTATPPPPAWLA